MKFFLKINSLETALFHSRDHIDHISILSPVFCWINPKSSFLPNNSIKLIQSARAQKILSLEEAVYQGAHIHPGDDDRMGQDRVQEDEQNETRRFAEK